MNTPRVPFAYQRYLARARLFQRESMFLADMLSAEPNWVRLFLIAHAFELAIKAYLELAKERGNLVGARAANHDLVGQYEWACVNGLPRNARLLDDLTILGPLHEAAYHRYPQDRARSIPMPSSFDDELHNLIELVQRELPTGLERR